VVRGLRVLKVNNLGWACPFPVRLMKRNVWQPVLLRGKAWAWPTLTM